MNNQIPGEDFQNFHGILLPYLHFPIFYLLGANFKAAEASRVILSPLLFLIGSFLFFLSCSRSRVSALFLWAIYLWIAFFTGQHCLIAPGGSLLPVRTFFPLIIVSLLISSYWQRTFSREFLLGVLIALAILCGTEQGIAVVGALILGTILLTVVYRNAIGIGTFISIAIAVITFIFALLLLTRGDFAALVKILRFNFSILPADQFWYFGAPPHNFIKRWQDLFADSSLMWTYVGLLGSLGLTMYFFSQKVISSQVLHAFVIFILYGIISTISYLGIQSFHYLAPSWRVSTLVLFALIHSASYSFFSNNRTRRSSIGNSLGGTKIFWIPTIFFLMWGFVLNHLDRTRPIKGMPLAQPDWKAWNSEMLATIEHDKKLHNGNADVKVWSTYSGLLEESLGIFNPSSDYIIHALGAEKRRAYVSTFEALNPQFVQTFRRSSWDFEEWLHVMHWPFFQTLLSKYEPLKIVQHSVLWKLSPAKSSIPKYLPWHEAKVERGKIYINGFTNNKTDHSILEVETTYKSENPWKSLPLLGAMPRYIIWLSGVENRIEGISLPPHEKQHTFPLYVKSGPYNLELHYSAACILPGVEMTVSSVRFREVLLSDNYLNALLD